MNKVDAFEAIEEVRKPKDGDFALAKVGDKDIKLWYIFDGSVNDVLPDDIQNLRDEENSNVRVVFKTLETGQNTPTYDTLTSMQEGTSATCDIRTRGVTRHVPLELYEIYERDDVEQALLGLERKLEETQHNEEIVGDKDPTVLHIDH